MEWHEELDDQERIRLTVATPMQLMIADGVQDDLDGVSVEHATPFGLSQEAYYQLRGQSRGTDLNPAAPPWRATLENERVLESENKGKGKRKKKVRKHSIGSVGENRQRSKDTDFFGRTFGMQMISDRFGDGWHKFVMYMFRRQQIAALFGDGVT